MSAHRRRERGKAEAGYTELLEIVAFPGSVFVRGEESVAGFVA